MKTKATSDPSRLIERVELGNSKEYDKKDYDSSDDDEQPDD